MARPMASWQSLLDDPYRPGERAMVKVKRLRTADCVVGGFRYLAGSREVGSCCSVSTMKTENSTTLASHPPSRRATGAV